MHYEPHMNVKHRLVPSNKSLKSSKLSKLTHGLDTLFIKTTQSKDFALCKTNIGLS